MPAPQPTLHRGRFAKPIRVLSVRALTREDLACLTQKRVGPPRAKAFRETHHRIARLVAIGVRPQEIAAMTGYTVTRIGSLRQDPAFEQLVTNYRGKVDEAFERQQDHFYSTAVEVKLRGLEMIADHLDKAEEEGDLIPLKTLIPLVADLADRTGHGKHSTQTKEVINFAEAMEQMARASGKSNVIDAKVVSKTEREGASPAAADPAPSLAPDAEGFQRQ